MSGTNNLFGANLNNFSNFGQANTIKPSPTPPAFNFGLNSTFGGLAGTTDSAKVGNVAFGASGNPVGAFGGLNFASKLAGNSAPNSNPYTSGFGASSNVNPGLAAQPRGPAEEAFDKILRSYAPLKDNQGNFISSGDGRKNEECQFKTIVLAHKSGTQLQRTLSGASEHSVFLNSLMEKAEKDNFDPSIYYPSEELGIEALKSRFENQLREISKMKEHIDKINELITLLKNGNIQLSDRISLLKMRQIPLNQRLLSILRKIEVLRCHGNSFQFSERQFQSKVTGVLEEISIPRQKLDEISVNLALQIQPQDLYVEELKNEELSLLINALKRQHEGLEFLSETLRKDFRDLNIMKEEIFGLE